MKKRKMGRRKRKIRVCRIDQRFWEGEERGVKGDMPEPVGGEGVSLVVGLNGGGGR